MSKMTDIIDRRIDQKLQAQQQEFRWLGNQLPKVEQLNEAIDKMWWFYRCGEPLDSRINSSGTKHTKRLYDYDIDSALIVSAFADTYGIDLVSSKMHWWQFKAYFAGLNESTRFVKVMSYRGMDLSQFKGKMRSFSHTCTCRSTGSASLRSFMSSSLHIICMRSARSITSGLLTRRCT